MADSTTVADAETVVEAVVSAMRPVVSLASPVVEEVAGTGLLEPVGTVVRPVTEPIVDALPPTLAPVLDLTQPIIGSPAAPSTPPTGPAADASTDEPPPSATPTTIVPPGPPTAAVQPSVPQAARASVTANLDDPRSLKAVGMSQVPWADDLAHALGLTMGAPASAVGQGCAAGGTGIAADASPRSWAPDLQPAGGYVTGGEKLAGRSGQPDTRPA